MKAGLENRATELRAALRQAGLDGRIQVGLPLPHTGPEVATSRSQKVKSSPGTEEGSSSPLDALLRPSTPGRPGQLIEITGELSTGRTALAYRLAAVARARGELVGWVDLPNALDPRFLRRSGVDLEGLLWVRPPATQPALRAAELLLKTGFALVVLDLEKASLTKLSSAVWLRLLRAAREARTTLVLLSTDRITGSFATLGLHTERHQAVFERGLFEGLQTRTTVLRNRSGPTGSEYLFHLSHRPISR